MRTFYSFLVQLTGLLLHLVAFFNTKIRLFLGGRKKTFAVLKENFPTSQEVIWMHVASLGEYEQGLPVLEALKKEYPNYRFLLTFFSPSGYEVKRDKTPSDLVVYLPLDTLKNSKNFLGIVQPKIAIFIKYEIWPNYLFELQNRNIPAFLVSGIFSKRQVFFKWYGSFMKEALKTFTHFFVQEDHSKELLKSIGLQNITVSGDTRFDRVYKIHDQENSLDFMETFKGNSKCLVAGSTWPEDEAVLLNFINRTATKLKIVIAPHNIKSKNLEALKSSISKKTVLYSNRKSADLSKAEVIIIDTIGLLTKIYSYADYAYVGGGFATGLHNTLEPAVFGIPVIIGPNYKGFNEVEELVQKEGVLTISDEHQFENLMDKLVMDEDLRIQTGQISTTYIARKTGATQKVMKHLKPLL